VAVGPLNGDGNAEKEDVENVQTKEGTWQGIIG
jgi:hypothetical protein